MFRKTLVWTTIGLMAFALWGCSSSRDSDGSKTGTDAGPDYVGIDVCVQCHDLKGQEWLYSRHGNSQPDLSPSSQHLPGESSCADCHNPLDDGNLIQTAFGTKEPRRDVIGCESCHGAGGQHFGLGPLPNAEPGPEVCGPCHNRDDRHHDSENSIYDKYLESRHVTGPIEGGQVCQRCHSHEGALASNVRGYTGDRDTILYSDYENRVPGRYAAPEIPEEELSPIQCATCHDPHSAGELRTVYSTPRELWDPNMSGGDKTDQFDLCTSCHLFKSNDGEIIASGTEESGTLAFFHNTAWYRIIATTHNDDPATGIGTGDENILEGYVIRANSENPCFDCHGHEMKTLTRPYAEGDARNEPTIYKQWASSAHAAEIFKKKLAAAAALGNGTDPSTAPRNNPAVVDAVQAAGSLGADYAWNHYPWSDQNRQSCQRCHTATGLANFLDDPEDYDPKNNDFSHLSGWTSDGNGNVLTSSGQAELLYCWGCHENAADGILRNPGELTLDFVYLDPNEQPGANPVFVTLPDKGHANVCGACHSGRGNNTSIRTGNRSTRFAGHHAPTAGSLYAEVTHTGFEYDGQDYAPVAFFAHDNILTNGDSPETGDGPCVGCHMGGDNNHTFDAVEHNAQGNISEIVNQALCNTCHTTHPMSPEILMEEEEGFEDARDLLTAYVKNVIPNYLGLDAQTNYQTVPLNAYGAVQNMLYMNDEPCIYVHNRYYGKRLIFDSIDFMDNGVLDGTITFDAEAYPGAAEWLGTTRP